jgi:hypothetical protein
MNSSHINAGKQMNIPTLIRDLGYPSSSMNTIGHSYEKYSQIFIHLYSVKLIGEKKKKIYKFRSLKLAAIISFTIATLSNRLNTLIGIIKSA